MDVENNIYEIYYDKEGDFLELSFGGPAKEGTTEEIEEGVFVSVENDTGEIRDIGILDFKTRVEILTRILDKYNIDLPLKIGI